MLQRVFQYADVQARVRARIGAMPDDAAWQRIATARDLDSTIQQMREHGLAHWVEDVSRSPDAGALERSLQQGCAALVNTLCRWLPPHWRAVNAWLNLGLRVGQFETLMNMPDPALAPGSDALLAAIAELPQAQRRDALVQAGYARFVLRPGPAALDTWLNEFERACPQLTGMEAYVLHRLRRLLVDHRRAVTKARREWNRTDRRDTSGIDLQWRAREQLDRRLRALLGGEPFHAGLVFVYALLELLQFERCRALLLARSNAWQSSGVV